MQKVKSGIELARKKAKISEADLAGRMKIDDSVLKGWEVGAGSMQITTLLKLAEILNASTDMLLFSEEREPLSLGQLKEEDRKIVINFYKKLLNE
ncbi:MAG: helix-turn-helix transcriptional regulator [Erysipelotrichaceae bacterium]|nr:helix-turn-helix transcriptional regulator [Erysipelotrichaceae bacterium]